MTANNSSSVESDNFASQSAKNGIHHSAHDPELVRIVRCAYAIGTTIQQSLVLETDLFLTELDELIQQLETEEYADFTIELDRLEVLLTTHRECCALEGMR